MSDNTTQGLLEYIPAIIGTFFILAFFGMIYLMMFHEIPHENVNIVNIVVGAIGGSVTTIIAFYFGSSKSSQKKDEALNEVATAKKEIANEAQ